ncbi:MAG: AAA family ATPase [Erysipelotrichaceae bacterium]|nr:AAA family ATPase [Erysipelotrichaceae bacterium]
MGIYFNPSNILFREERYKEFYVDKSMLISAVENIVKKENKYISFSRPRRFGKNTDAYMFV